MRYRLPEWDVPMPPPLVAYWTAWNESDVDSVSAHLAIAVTPEVEWNDPRDSFVGIDALEGAIRSLRSRHRDYWFKIVSEIDHHHGRLRYRWDMGSRGRILMEGLDVVTLDPGSRLICRVDGFFGDPTPAEDADSGVPVQLRSGRGDGEAS